MEVPLLHRLNATLTRSLGCLTHGTMGDILTLAVSLRLDGVDFDGLYPLFGRPQSMFGSLNEL